MTTDEIDRVMQRLRDGATVSTNDGRSEIVEYCFRDGAWRMAIWTAGRTSEQVLSDDEIRRHIRYTPEFRVLLA